MPIVVKSDGATAREYAMMYIAHNIVSAYNDYQKSNNELRFLKYSYAGKSLEYYLKYEQDINSLEEKTLNNWISIQKRYLQKNNAACARFSPLFIEMDGEFYLEVDDNELFTYKELHYDKYFKHLLLDTYDKAQRFIRMKYNHPNFSTEYTKEELLNNLKSLYDSGKMIYANE